MSDWNEAIQKSIAGHPTITEHLRRSERAEENPVIALLSPGERPTEPGWYVVNSVFGLKGADATQFNKIAHVVKGEDGSLRYDDGTKLGKIAARHIFIARIYPDRIEGREG